jgi:hypothetical protein
MAGISGNPKASFEALPRLRQIIRQPVRSRWVREMLEIPGLIVAADKAVRIIISTTNDLFKLLKNQKVKISSRFKPPQENEKISYGEFYNNMWDMIVFRKQIVMVIDEFLKDENPSDESIEIVFYHLDEFFISLENLVAYLRMIIEDIPANQRIKIPLQLPEAMAETSMYIERLRSIFFNADHQVYFSTQSREELIRIRNGMKDIIDLLFEMNIKFD